MDVSVASVMIGHKHGVYDLKIYDGYVFSAASDSIVAQWDFKAGVFVQMILTGTLPIYSLSIQADKLACGQRNGELIFTDLATKQLIAKILIGKKEIFFVHLLGEDGNEWLAGGGDGNLYFGNLLEKDKVHIVPLSTTNLRCIDVCHQKDEIAIGSSDNFIYILSLADKKVKSVIKGCDNSVFTLKYLDENTLLSGSRDALLRVWKRKEEKWEVLELIPAHNFTINKIAIHPSGKYFATASRDKSIKLWSAENFRLLKVLSPEKFLGIHTHSINSLVWDNDFLVSTGDDKKIVSWQISLPL